MIITETQIKEIAEDLECGMSCFLNLKTGELKTIPNFESWMETDEEPWEDDLKEIKEHSGDYFEFKGFESNESYQLMADFAENINDTEFQAQLVTALYRPKPFQNFKWQIDNSGIYRQQWFDFKKTRYIQRVKDQVDIVNQDIDE